MHPSEEVLCIPLSEERVGIIGCGPGLGGCITCTL